MKRFDDGGEVDTSYDSWDFGNYGSGLDFSTYDLTGGDVYDIPQSDIDALMNLGGTPEEQAATRNTLENLISRAGSGIMKLFQDKQGNLDWKKVATVGGGLLGAINAMRGGNQQQQPASYQGGIPKYTAVRERVDVPFDPTRRPGSMARRYFTDVAYTPEAGVQAAKEAAVAEAQKLQEANKAAQEAMRQTEEKPAEGLRYGGIATLAKGRYLRGETDGMEDKIPASIENRQPAALSHGEFVIPADVVSHLGNGNSDAGAKRLYDMMDRIRKARTGTEKQGKQISPNKYLPV